MTGYAWVLAVVFLPLFPFSALFVLLLRRCGNPWLRAGVFLLWPQVGLILLKMSGLGLAGETAASIPDWLALWAVATALLYAFRAVVLREAGLWTAFIAVSIGATLWLVHASHSVDAVRWMALGLTLPLALFALLTGEIEKRFDAAYSGLIGGMATRQPRLAGLIVVTILAITATPVFPGFFALLGVTLGLAKASPMIAALLLLVWLLWSWSGMRLLSGLVMGAANTNYAEVNDLPRHLTWTFSALLVVLALTGLITAGALL